ncbi:hypothetical protein BJ742DRAFT_854354 [Cladochytrium replicatum]|nr:hypothetical protein BJ742DRAFT_854354 [Cladochytrium replicatum]
MARFQRFVTKRPESPSRAIMISGSGLLTISRVLGRVWDYTGILHSAPYVRTGRRRKRSKWIRSQNGQGARLNCAQASGRSHNTHLHWSVFSFSDSLSSCFAETGFGHRLDG